MKPKIIIGVLIIVAALAYLIIGGVKETAIYYLTIPELFAKSELPIGEGVRVSGYVIPESIEWSSEKIQLRFAMAEEGDTLRVLYNGIMPDQLAEAQQVVAEGIIDSTGVLVANKLLLKCPSKYDVSDQDRYDRSSN